MKTIFSLKALAACWAGLLVALGVGAAALQLATPLPPPPVVEATALPAAPAIPEPAAAPMGPATPPLPFQNRSLLAMLPPASRPALRPAPALPVPPVPPTRHLARAEPRRAVPLYAADSAPAYDAAGWARGMPYPGLYARWRQYPYAAPQTYYGW